MPSEQLRTRGLSSLMQRRDTALIKKKTKFSSYIRKFRWDRVQNHIQYEEGLPNYISGNVQICSPYIRRSLVIYVFAPDSSKFPKYEENYIFFFIRVLTNERCSYDNTITTVPRRLYFPALQ